MIPGQWLGQGPPHFLPAARVRTEIRGRSDPNPPRGHPYVGTYPWPCKVEIFALQVRTAARVYVRSEICATTGLWTKAQGSRRSEEEQKRFGELFFLVRVLEATDRMNWMHGVGM